MERPQNPTWFGPWFGLVWPGFTLALRWFSRRGSSAINLVWPMVWLAVAWFPFGLSSFLQFRPGLPARIWPGSVVIDFYSQFNIERTTWGLPWATGASQPDSGLGLSDAISMNRAIQNGKRWDSRGSAPPVCGFVRDSRIELPEVAAQFCLGSLGFASEAINDTNNQYLNPFAHQSSNPSFHQSINQYRN